MDGFVCRKWIGKKLAHQWKDERVPMERKGRSQARPLSHHHRQNLLHLVKYRVCFIMSEFTTVKLSQ